MSTWTQNFLRLVGLRPTMMPIEGVAFRASWRSMCLLRDFFFPLDPHLVDASVNFEDLGYLQLLIFAFASCNSCIFRLRLSSTLSSTFGGRQILFRGLRLSSNF